MPHVHTRIAAFSATGDVTVTGEEGTAGDTVIINAGSWLEPSPVV